MEYILRAGRINERAGMRDRRSRADEHLGKTVGGNAHDDRNIGSDKRNIFGKRQDTKPKEGQRFEKDDIDMYDKGMVIKPDNADRSHYKRTGTDNDIDSIDIYDKRSGVDPDNETFLEPYIDLGAYDLQANPNEADIGATKKSKKLLGIDAYIIIYHKER